MTAGTAASNDRQAPTAQLPPVLPGLQPNVPADVEHRRQALRRDLKERLLKLHLHDGRILTHLLSMTAGGEYLAAFYVIPLVSIAWADDRMDDAEREAIGPVVEAEGLCQGSGGAWLLQHWLHERPAPEVLDAWHDYVREWSALLPGAERAQLRAALGRHAHAVAASAGSKLGLGERICNLERGVMDAIDRAFG